MTTIEVRLPDELAQEAQRAGLFEQAAFERLIREALSAERVQGLKQARTRLAANPIPPMTPQEIQAEIDAWRAECRGAAGA